LGDELAGRSNQLLFLRGALLDNRDACCGQGKGKQRGENGHGAPASEAVAPDAGVQEGTTPGAEIDAIGDQHGMSS
jgi:hypothetical protein